MGHILLILYAYVADIDITLISEGICANLDLSILIGLISHQRLPGSLQPPANCFIVCGSFTHAKLYSLSTESIKE
jgi:hypothetical protein